MDFNKLEELLSKSIERKKDEAEAQKHGTVVMSFDDGIIRFQSEQDKEIKEMIDAIPEKFSDTALEFVKGINQVQRKANETKRELSRLEETQKLKDEQPQQPNTDSPNQSKKIRWKGTPQQLGYIVYELALKGYIDYPLSKGEMSYAKLAEQVLETFEVTNNNGNPTSKKHLSNCINPKEQKLDDIFQRKFTIPNQTDTTNTKD